MTVQHTDPATAEDRLVRARAFADGEVPASPDGMRLGREIVRDLLAEVKEISRELHAYKRAKAENDERFQLAAAKAQQERDAALSELEAAQARIDAARAIRSKGSGDEAAYVTGWNDCWREFRAVLCEEALGLGEEGDDV